MSSGINRSTPHQTLSAMTQQWSNYSLCCCIYVVLMLRMIIKENTEIAILTLFPQCTISFYIFDNTLPCKLPEDRQSNFAQVWKVMENDIIQQPSCPESVSLIYDHDRGWIFTITPDLHFSTRYAPKLKLKTKHAVIWGDIQSHSVWGFILLSLQCNQKEMKSFWWHCYRDQFAS